MSNKYWMVFKPQSVVPEANIKAEFYYACKTNDIPIYFEYYLQLEGKGNNNCIFDAVIHDHQYLLAIIEFKRQGKGVNSERKWVNSKQYKSYSSFGLPVYLITINSNVTQIIKGLRELLGNEIEHPNRCPWCHAPFGKSTEI